MTAGPIPIRGAFVRTRHGGWAGQGDDPSQHDVPTLWDAIEARDEALLRVQAHSVPWRTVAWDVLRAEAEHNPYLTSESLWKALDDLRIPRPEERRAMGPLLMRAAREGVVTFDHYERSTVPGHHKDIQAVWRSLVVR